MPAHNSTVNAMQGHGAYRADRYVASLNQNIAGGRWRGLHSFAHDAPVFVVTHWPALLSADVAGTIAEAEIVHVQGIGLVAAHGAPVLHGYVVAHRSSC